MADACTTRVGTRVAGVGCESNPYLEMAMVAEQPGYRSYLLRLWQVGGADMPIWRVSLEDVRTHERRNFASLEQLCAFLATPIQRGAEDTEPPPSPASTDAGHEDV